jgi:WD40 repeat protein
MIRFSTLLAAAACSIPAAARSADPRELAVLSGHPGQVYTVAFSPDGKLLAAGAQEGTRPLPPGKHEKRATKLWDVAAKRLIATLDGDAPQFSSDGKWVVTRTGEKEVVAWDAATRKEIHRFKDVRSARFAPGGLAIAGTDGKVRVRDLAAGKDVLTFDYPIVTFSEDGKSAAVTTKAGEIILLDPITGKVRSTLKAHTEAPRIAFSPDGSILASTQFLTETVILWDVAKGVKRSTVSGPRRYFIAGIRFSPDGKLLAGTTMHSDPSVIAPECHVRLWSTETGQTVATHDGHTAAVWSLAFSPNGRLLATTSAESDVRVWDLKTGEQLAALKGHKVRALGVHSVAFSPDSRTLASGSDDDTVRLWDVSELVKP